MYVLHQVSVILICFNPLPLDMRIADRFIDKINELSKDKFFKVEAYLLYDP